MPTSTETKRRFLSVPITEEKRQELEAIAAEKEWSLAKVARNLMDEALAARANAESEIA